MNLKDLILEKVESAFDKTASDFAEAQRLQMDAEVYEWPRVTERVNGEVVSSPRDIVDTGELQDSQEHTKLQRFRHEYLYSPEYASLVHEGGVNENGTNYPARPWIEDSAIELDIADTFGFYLKEELG